MVETNLTPQDTVYQVMGIVKKMQKLVDRTVLLGEVRADLVNVNASASLDLKELAANNVSETNAYNNPSDYYDVINSCNIYLAYVDGTQVSNGELKFLKEIIAVKCYRAWAYLELAKIYGEVPFVTEPILTADAAEQAVASGERKDMVGICDYLIEDLKEYGELSRNDKLRQSYSASFTDGSDKKMSMEKCFFPVRVMLGELYLWRGSFTQNRMDFEEAARYYHDYLAFTNEEVNKVTTMNNVAWNNPNFTTVLSNYTSFFSMSNAETLTAIPMDTVEFYGTYTDLAALFNSQHKNNYYVAISPSERIREISQAQTYCYLNKGTLIDDTLYAPKDKSQFDNEELKVGDLRLFSVLTEMSYNDKYHGEYSKERQSIAKYPTSSSITNTSADKRLETVTLLRRGTVYLHMAEALNRAGFPETAFAVLKHGLTEDALQDTTIVSKNEYARLSALTSRGFTGYFTTWNPNRVYSLTDAGNLSISGGSMFSSSTAGVQIGMHSRGSGDSQVNETYYLPADSASVELMAYDEALALKLSEEGATAEDTLAYHANRAEVDEHNYVALQPSRIEKVDSLILEEMALELMFEGHRYYDLMRYSKFNGKPNFLAERIAERAGKEGTIDSDILTRLSNENWYLPLRKR